MKRSESVARLGQLLFLLFLVVAAGVWILAATESESNAAGGTIYVTTTNDENSGSGSTGCSLREAIWAIDWSLSWGGCSNPGGTAGTIVVPEGTYVLTMTSPQRLQVYSSMIIKGAGPDKTIISPTNDVLDRVFEVNLGANESVTMSQMTIQGGRTGFAGGGVSVRCVEASCSWALEDAVVRENHSDTLGGGIYIKGGGSVRLNRVAIVGNYADLGGGIHYGAFYVTDTMRMTNVTISGNEAQTSGGGLYLRYGDYASSGWNGSSNSTATNVTFEGNRAHDGSGVSIYNDRSVMTLKNTVVSGGTDSTGANNCAGNAGANITSMGYNLDSGDTCGLDRPADLTGTLPLLEPLADYGGGTLSHRPQATSPAVDHIPATVSGCGTDVVDDQRQVSRPQPDTGACDIGAVELDKPAGVILVTTIDDEYDGAIDKGCSLREAVRAINQGASFGGCDNTGGTAHTIDVPQGTYVLTQTGLGEPYIYESVTIQGAGPGRTVISTTQGWAERVLSVRPSGSDGITVTGMTVQGGRGRYGGGLYMFCFGEGSFTLEDAILRDNRSRYCGGGLMAEGCGSIHLNRVAIVDNQASCGGGMYYGALYEPDSLEMINVTIAGNWAEQSGGGLYLNYGATSDYDGPSKTAATYVTLEGNSVLSGTGGNIYNNQSIVTLKNSIVSGGTDSTGPNNCAGNPGPEITSQGYNLDSGDTCGLNGTADLTETLPLLGPLADYGGGTLSHRPAPTSPVVGHIPATANGCGTEIDDDQRKISRPQPAAGDCDIGAVELEQPVLGIAKWVRPEEGVATQDLVTYTIVLSNTGDGDAEGVQLTDTLPAKVEFATWLERPAGASVDSGVLTWQGTVPGGQTVIITFQVTFTGGYGDVVTNTATYTHSSGGGSSQGAPFAAVSGYKVYLPVVIKAE